MSLYLKYRPRNIEELVGQNHIKKTITHAFEQNSISHAYLFSGPRGTGKTSTARVIARALTVDSPELAKMADENRLLDIIEIDAASNRGIDEIRDLKEKIQFSPIMAQRKVYIIDEVHMLTKEAFNALLKTLEEPPAHGFFILATTEIHKVPDTIISRCQHFSFQRISEKDICGRLQYICKQEKVTADDQALMMIAKHAQGGMRNAISMLEQAITNKTITIENLAENLGLSSEESQENFLQFLYKNNPSGALEIIESILYEGLNIQQFIHRCLEISQKHLYASLKKEIPISPQKIIEIAEELLSAYQKTKNSPIETLPLELSCIRLCKQPLDKKSESSQTIAQESFDKPIKKPIEKPIVIKKPMTTEKTEEPKEERNLSDIADEVFGSLDI